MFGFSKKRKASQARDAAMSAKMQESQSALLQAATETANVANDVTVMLRDKLSDSLRQIETTANILPDALLICSESGIIETINPAAEKIFQWNKADVVGKHITVLFKGEHGEDITVDDFLKCAVYCNETIYEVSAMECVRGKRRNGETFWVEVSAKPLPRTASTAVVILCRDATTRIELTKRLEENESKFRSIFDASMDGIVVVANGMISTCNSSFSKLFGMVEENMIATPISEWVNPDHHSVCEGLETLVGKHQMRVASLLFL